MTTDDNDFTESFTTTIVPKDKPDGEALTLPLPESLDLSQWKFAPQERMFLHARSVAAMDIRAQRALKKKKEEEELKKAKAKTSIRNMLLDFS